MNKIAYISVCDIHTINFVQSFLLKFSESKQLISYNDFSWNFQNQCRNEFWPYVLAWNFELGKLDIQILKFAGYFSEFDR